MKKHEALVKIHMTMDQVKHACRKSERKPLLEKLQFYYDLVNHYKTSEGFFNHIVNECHTLINRARDDSTF